MEIENEEEKEKEGQGLQEDGGGSAYLFQRDVKKALQRDDVRSKTIRMSRGSPDSQEVRGYFQLRELCVQGNCVYNNRIKSGVNTKCLLCFRLFTYICLFNSRNCPTRCGSCTHLTEKETEVTGAASLSSHC